MNSEMARNRVDSQEIGGDRNAIPAHPAPSPPVDEPTREVGAPMTAMHEGRATPRGRPLVIVREGDGDERHGKLSTYTNHECRCPQCSQAKRDYDRDLRVRRRRAREG